MPIKKSRAASRRTGVDATAALLDGRQIAALLRDVSFHRSGHTLRRLLDRLAAGSADTPVARSRLATVLPASDRARLSRYVATLNRLATKTVRPARLPFCRARRGGSYFIHPATRKALREILPAIERAGDREEPLWE